MNRFACDTVHQALYALPPAAWAGYHDVRTRAIRTEQSLARSYALVGWRESATAAGRRAWVLRQLQGMAQVLARGPRHG